MATHRSWGCVVLTFVACTAVFVDSRAFNDVHDLSSEFYSEVREIMDRRNSMDRRLFEQADAPSMADTLAMAPAPPKPRVVLQWPLHGAPPVGQVAGVAVALDGFPVVFHRGARVFEANSFNMSHHFQQIEDGPIPEDTVLTLDPDNGDVLAGWGRDLFYMPHSITIDNRGNTWLTDVALHQVFKFLPGQAHPNLTIGEKFTPGKGHYHLCMPTDIAIASTGEVFVSDGYCNARILKYDPSGAFIRGYPTSPDELHMQVPHSVTLLERLDLVCVADRERQRVVCLSAELRAERPPGPDSHVVIQHPEMGRVFAVAANGDFLYAVNGLTSESIPVQGFTLDPASESVLNHWGPPQGMNNPHSLAVSPDGSALYVAEIGPNRVWKFDLV